MEKICRKFLNVFIAISSESTDCVNFANCARKLVYIVQLGNSFWVAFRGGLSLNRYISYFYGLQSVG